MPPRASSRPRLPGRWLARAGGVGTVAVVAVSPGRIESSGSTGPAEWRRGAGVRGVPRADARGRCERLRCSTRRLGGPAVHRSPSPARGRRAQLGRLLRARPGTALPGGRRGGREHDGVGGRARAAGGRPHRRRVRSTTTSRPPASTATCGTATCCGRPTASCSSTRPRTAATARRISPCSRSSAARSSTTCSRPTIGPGRLRRGWRDRVPVHQLHPLAVHAAGHRQGLRASPSPRPPERCSNGLDRVGNSSWGTPSVHHPLHANA